MKDFIAISIKSDLTKVEIHEILSSNFLDFTWRMGDSDAAGGYVSGMNSDGVQVKCWTGEKPYDFSISFRSVKANAQANENIYNRFVNCISSEIGEIIKIDE